jgi:type II secretory pathway pseudopilin PulG
VPKPYAEQTREAKAIEDRLSDRRRGIVTSLLAPALSSCIQSGIRSQALHRAAAVAVAATRYRIEKGSLPKSLDDLVPPFLPVEPADPFAAAAPLRLKWTDDALLIYSVGRDGEDDGGPLPPGTEPAAGNDDVGLRLTQSSSRTQ